MSYVKIKSNWLFLCAVITLFLLKPSAINAQTTEQAEVPNGKGLESLNVRSDAKKLAQFEREEVEVDIIEPVDGRTSSPHSYIGIGGNIGLGGDDTQIA